jgi:hypothetical protein
MNRVHASRTGPSQPNQITGPKAGGPRQFPIRTPLAARVGQFYRWMHEGCE